MVGELEALDDGGMEGRAQIEVAVSSTNGQKEAWIYMVEDE